MKQETKKWYQSKTMWLNAFAVIVGVCTALVGQLQAGEVITLLGVVNIILRYITKAEIK